MIWNLDTKRSWTAEQHAAYNLLKSLPGADAVVSAIMSESGERQLARDGYTRDKRQRNLGNAIWKMKQGARSDWQDHEVALRGVDGRRAYLCEPYGLDSAGMQDILRVCESLNLRASISPSYGIWYPARTTPILLRETGD